jgi:ATP adenylyltransferase
MGERESNLWAPWRMEYLERLSGGEPLACFLCAYRDNPAADRANHVLWRSPQTLVVLNRFPYSIGHLLICPAAHQAELEQLPDDVLAELSRRVRDAKRVLQRLVQAQGFNIGINLGRCAGAGLPDHLHWHVVPRWGGDTNFISVVGETRVIPETLDGLYERFLHCATEMGLPT